METDKRGLLSAYYLELTAGLRRGELMFDPDFFRHTYDKILKYQDPVHHHRPCVQQYYAEYLCPCDR